MLPFFIRILLFAATWSLVFITDGGKPRIWLLFLCVLSLTIYFLIPLFKKKIVPFGLLCFSTILFALVLGEGYSGYFLLILFLYGLDGAFYIAPRFYDKFLLLAGPLLLIGMIFFFEMDRLIIFSYFVLIMLFTVMLGYLNRYMDESKEKVSLYEELLGEYRRIKRHAHQHEQVVRNEERARIAREMHDSVGHKLTALAMQIELLLMEEENDLLRGMKNTVNESLEETRKAVRALSIDEIEGISSVIHLIRKLESESKMRIHFATKQGSLSVPLSNESSIVLYRVLQESLTNAMKYGTSREVNITLAVSPIGHLTFEIKNKYDGATPFHEGFGLRNMRKRVEEIKGRLQFYQTDNSFIVEGTIPGKGDKQ